MPADTFQCPQCGSTLRRPPKSTSASGAPLHVRCPRCQHQFPIPPIEAELAPPLPAAPPPAPPLRDRVVESPAAPARPSFPEEDTFDFTESPRPRDQIRARGEYEEDEDYPYRPPGHLDPSELSSDYVVDIGAWFRYASAHWSSILGPAIGFILILFVIGAATSCIPFFSIVLQYLVVYPMGAGLTLVSLKQLKGEPWTFGDFFGGFQHYTALLLPNLIIMGPGLVGVVLQPAFQFLIVGSRNPYPALGAFVGAWLVLLCVYSFFYVRFLTFSWHLIFDRHYNGIEALKGSWRLSRGHFWILFALYLLLGLINAGGYLALCIGLLFTIPLGSLVNASGYLIVAGTRPPQKRPYTAYRRDDEYEYEEAEEYPADADQR